MSSKEGPVALPPPFGFRMPGVAVFPLVFVVAGHVRVLLLRAAVQSVPRLNCVRARLPSTDTIMFSRPWKSEPVLLVCICFAIPTQAMRPSGLANSNIFYICMTYLYKRHGPLRGHWRHV